MKEDILNEDSKIIALVLDSFRLSEFLHQLDMLPKHWRRNE